jgi:glyoxylase-like metal-dependent hydrolase (beta-lactamase superfamily II)
VTAAAGDAARQVRSQPSLNTRGLAGREETLSGGRDTQQFFPTAEFWYIDVVPAFATFTDRLDVYVDDLKLELHYVGPAHTTNDAVVWIPERRLMFSGDIAFNGGTPFIVPGVPRRPHRRVRARERVRRRAHRPRVTAACADPRRWTASSPIRRDDRVQ